MPPRVCVMNSVQTEMFGRVYSTQWKDRLAFTYDILFVLTGKYVRVVVFN